MSETYIMRQKFAGCALEQLAQQGLDIEIAHRCATEGTQVFSDAARRISIRAFAPENVNRLSNAEPAARSVRVAIMDGHIVWAGFTGDYVSHNSWRGNQSIIDYVQKHPLVTVRPN